MDLRDLKIPKQYASGVARRRIFLRLSDSEHEAIANAAKSLNYDIRPGKGNRRQGMATFVRNVLFKAIDYKEPAHNKD